MTGPSMSAGRRRLPASWRRSRRSDGGTRRRSARAGRRAPAWPPSSPTTRPSSAPSGPRAPTPNTLLRSRTTTASKPDRDRDVALALAVASRRALTSGRVAACTGGRTTTPRAWTSSRRPIVDWSTPPDAQRAVRQCAEDVASGRAEKHESAGPSATRTTRRHGPATFPRSAPRCAYGYYYCPNSQRSAAATSSKDKGALQSLLTPTAAVAERVGRILGLRAATSASTSAGRRRQGPLDALGR